MVSEAFMPVSYGGGVASVETALQLIRLGVEKIVINTAAAQYAANRPSYPPALFDAVEELAGRPLAGARAADIGAGTGIATALLHARGAEVVAVEPGEGMAAQFRRTHPGSVEVEMVDGDNTVRGSDAGFLCYRFENGGWIRRRVFLPEQPSVGFTVARTEDNSEMQRLCRVFEASDDEGRRLIRLFAELSVSDALEIPPRA